MIKNGLNIMAPKMCALPIPILLCSPQLKGISFVPRLMELLARLVNPTELVSIAHGQRNGMYAIRSVPTPGVPADPRVGAAVYAPVGLAG